MWYFEPSFFFVYFVYQTKLAFSDDSAALCRLKQFPATLDVLLLESRYYAVGNFLKVARR